MKISEIATEAAESELQRTGVPAGAFVQRAIDSVTITLRERAEAAEMACKNALKELVNMQPHVAEVEPNLRAFLDTHLDIAMNELTKGQS